MPIDSKQYNSAAHFMEDQHKWGNLVRNVSNDDDRLRLKAYELWEDMYANRPEDHLTVQLRGEDEDSVEIYLPSAKKCIEAVNRFLAVDFDWTLDPEEGEETDNEDGAVNAAVESAMANLFKRQDIAIKFNNMKRYMLVKGDALFHVHAHGWERAGRRIQVDELKPEHYFPIEDPVTGISLGCHIVDVIRNPRNSARTKGETDDFIVRRQTYRFLVDDKGLPTPQAVDETGDGGGIVTSELGLYSIAMWDDRNDDNEIHLIEELQQATLLHPSIDQIPVYHWRNSPPPNSSFGISELAGLESLVIAMNQAASDEDLVLITQGLGVYWTDAAAPTDENGDEIPWEIGPGSVVRVGVGGNFGRVTGVSSVAPYHDHIKLLDENMQQGMGVPDIAIGMVDTAQAESGIALQLKFGPLLAKCKEKEQVLEDITDCFLEDLLKWLQVYEGVGTQGAVVTCTFGDPMPRNKAEELKNVLDIWTQCASALPISWLYEQLNDIMGYELDENADFDQAIEDAKKIAESAMPADPFGQQMGDEQGFGEGGLQGQPDPNAAPLNGASNGQYAFSGASS